MSVHRSVAAVAVFALVVVMVMVTVGVGAGRHTGRGSGWPVRGRMDRLCRRRPRHEVLAAQSDLSREHRGPPRGVALADSRPRAASIESRLARRTLRRYAPHGERAPVHRDTAGPDRRAGPGNQRDRVGLRPRNVHVWATGQCRVPAPGPRVLDRWHRGAPLARRQ